MLFVGIALLVAAGLALLISVDAGSLVGLSQAQTAQLVPLLILVVVIAGGVFSRRHRLSELMSGIAIWAGLFAVVLVGYSYRDELFGIAGRVLGELTPGIAVVDGERGTATFRRGLGGHFEVRAEINGEAIPLIFDTGASAVVLSTEDALRAGIDLSRLRYTVPVSTANGMARAAIVTLDRLDIGPIRRRGIRAFIAEDGALETSLLGMTYLETLARYSVTGNSLELVD